MNKSQKKGGNIDSLLAEARERIRQRKALVDTLCQDEAPVMLTNPAGSKALVSRSTYHSLWRITYLGADGIPQGHTDHQDKPSALNDALQQGYEVTSKTIQDTADPPAHGPR